MSYAIDTANRPLSFFVFLLYLYLRSRVNAVWNDGANPSTHYICDSISDSIFGVIRDLGGIILYPSYVEHCMETQWYVEEVL